MARPVGWSAVCSIFMRLGPVLLKKGLPEPVEAFGAGGKNSRRRAASKHCYPAELTPLIGRQEELDLLLRRWRQCA